MQFDRLRRRHFITLLGGAAIAMRRVTPARAGSHFRFYAPKEVNLVERGAIWISENS
jgi:hypothetical protein